MAHKNILILSALCILTLLNADNTSTVYIITLKDIQTYAAQHPEDVKIDNNNTQYPDFTTTYEANQPTFFQKIKNYFTRHPAPILDADYFKALLEEVTTSLEKQEVTHNHEKTINLPPEGTVIFWGSLFGSYHSLARTLTELYNQKTINNELKIIKKECYFVFIGDTINFSPYTIETLTVILTLMKQNPDKVIYLQGQQERNGYWENFNMRQALKMFASHLVTPEDLSIPLSSLLKKFFKTLPEILIIRRDPEEKGQAFYAAHTLSENILRKTEVEAALFGERELGGANTSGLEFIGYDHGTAVWSLMSCPNVIYQKFYKFYYDSFAVFKMGERLLTSTLTVFNQDVRKKDGFQSTSFDILYAIPIKNKDEIKKIHLQRPFEIGSTMPLSGSAGILGNTVATGLNASMYNFNTTQALDLNLFIRNNIFDDQLSPRLARSNVKTLHTDYKIDFFLLPIGTSTLATYLPSLEQENIFVFFPFTGTALARNPLLKNIINLRASDADEVHALIDYIIAEYRSKRFAFFYQNDSYGKDCVEAAHNELKKRGITSWTDIPYTTEQTDFVAQAEELKKTNPDAIGFFSNSAPTQEFINQVGTDFFMGINLFGVSFLEGISLRLFLKQQGIKFTFSSVFPDPTTNNLPLIKEYRIAMDRLGLKYNSDSLEGYIATEIFLDALIHVKPKLLCKDTTCSLALADRIAVMNYLESLKNYNFKGLNLTFNPKNRSFDLPVWIETEDGEWIEYDTKSGARVKKDEQK